MKLLNWLGAIATWAAVPAQEAAAVTVRATVATAPQGGAVYCYHLHNPGPGVVTAFVIDSGSAGTAARAGTGAVAADDQEPDAAPIGPPGWKGVRITTEEMQYVRIEWHGSRETGIRPGASARFEVTLRRPQPLYLRVRWTAQFSDGTAVSRQLQADGAAGGAG